MSWMERFGKYLALTWLVLVWPSVQSFAQGNLHDGHSWALLAALAAYSLTYGWYCLAGHRVRDLRVPVATVAALTLLAAVLDQLSGQPTGNNFLVPLMVAGFALRSKSALVAFAIVAAVMAADEILLAKLTPPQLVLQLVLIVPIVILFGGSAMGLRYLLDTLGQLRAARAEIAQHAADQERSRIARDLHDLLGHSLSLITLKGELATRLLPEGAPGTDEVRDILGLSRQALQQVREAVSGYRQPTLATEVMAARVALAAAGIEVEIQQEVGALDRETEAVVGWVIREGSTNVIRHSGARHCRIAVTRAERHLTIEVSNDGWRVPQTSAGNGLRGLEERLSALGGSFEASALPDAGFQLTATIPTDRLPAPHAIDAEVAR